MCQCLTGGPTSVPSFKRRTQRLWAFTLLQRAAVVFGEDFVKQRLGAPLTFLTQAEPTQKGTIINPAVRLIQVPNTFKLMISSAELCVSGARGNTSPPQPWKCGVCQLVWDLALMKLNGTSRKYE